MRDVRKGEQEEKCFMLQGLPVQEECSDLGFAVYGFSPDFRLGKTERVGACMIDRSRKY